MVSIKKLLFIKNFFYLENMKNYLYNEFVESCAMIGIAPSVWASENGFTKTLPTNLKNGTRPAVETLQKLITAWPNKDIGLRIALAYLKDEIERIGLNLDTIEPVLKTESATSSSLDDDLKTIQSYLNRAPIRQSVHEIAELLKVSEWAQEDKATSFRIALEAAERGQSDATKNAKNKKRGKTA